MKIKPLFLFILIVALLLFAWFVINQYVFLPHNNSQVTNQTNSEMINEKQGMYEVKVQNIFYFDEREGYLAKPSLDGSYPGIVMIHEWWGLNDHIKEMARNLASHGYTVLAVDLYGEVAKTPDRARELRTSINQEEANRNLQSALNYLRNEGALRVASLGYCFGGGQSLELALSGEDLDATVIYYGSLTSEKERLSQINWPVLGIFGEEDTSISVESVNEFDQVLSELDINHQIYIYPNVGHAFANPSGNNYSKEETMDAWQKTLQFLENNLK